MSREEWYALGQRFRSFLLDLENNDPTLANFPPSNLTSRYESLHDNSSGVRGIFNRAAKIKAGNLLVNYLAQNACYQVDPKTGEFEFLFKINHEQNPFLWRAIAHPIDGSIYCAISGAKDPNSPTKDAVFGLAGAILKIDIARAEITALSIGDDIIDPCGMQILDDHRLLVCDFGGFSGRGQIYRGSGSIYTIDRVTGEQIILAQNGLLKDPVSAHMDNEGILWVANAYMHYQYTYRAGDLEKDDGEVLRITPDSIQTIILPRISPAIGSIVGIHAANDPSKLVIIRGDWPLMETGAVLLMDKETGNTETLLQASKDKPQFYTNHVDVDGNILWVAECYNKKILAYDLESRSIVKSINYSELAGNFSGVASSFEGIESISLIRCETT